LGEKGAAGEGDAGRGGEGRGGGFGRFQMHTINELVLVRTDHY